MTSRRHFVGGCFGWGLGAAACGEDRSELRGEVIVSAQGDDADRYAVTGSDREGAVASVRTGFRGHGLVVHPVDRARVVMVSRRPGTALVLADMRRAEVVVRVEARPGTHFFGHGAFDPTGARLYTTEADVAAGVGLIGVRDGVTLELIEHLPSHGIGPHELVMMPDGETLAVANGGILTRPDTGRDKLNLETMDPNLSYVDRQSGELLEALRLDESKSSIRHMAVASDATVAVGVQLQREVTGHADPVALGALHRRGEALRPLQAEEAVWWGFDDYVGSVAIDDRRGLVAMTSPRGNVVGFWSLATGAFAGRVTMNDASGVTVTRDGFGFACSNSLGDLRFIDGDTLEEDPSRHRAHPDLRWDNHLATLSIS
ncbi:MAG: DUF1513 domain-containing protein [Myxococcota bacterium]